MTRDPIYQDYINSEPFRLRSDELLAEADERRQQWEIRDDEWLGAGVPK